jgi:hypothetical protein
MRRALLFALTALLAAPPAIAASNAKVPDLLASAPGLIRQKQQVPDDPLAGLPTGDGDDGSRRGKGGGKGARSCRLDARAANPRDVGDLRATLAFVKRGPKVWPCPPRQVEDGGVKLRIAIDGGGKITGVEPAGNDAGMAAALAKKLIGRTIAPRLDGPTLGTTVLSFASKR